MKDKIHWLLESTGKAPGIIYFSGFTQSGLSVSVNYDRALKFGTKKEAESFMKRNGLVDWEALEHMWCVPLDESRKVRAE